MNSAVFRDEVLMLSQTMEVATARVYNWDVAQRRKDKLSGESAEEGKATEPNG
jgi:hypothetical protein